MRESSRSVWIILVWCLSSQVCISQSRSQLEDERNRIIEQIEQTSANLKQTATSKKSTLSDLKAIENQIKNRKDLIQNIKSQLANADQEIKINTGKIDSLDQDIIALDEQYQQLARHMYLRTLAGSKWAYVFSASSVNDAFLRWRYSKQYESFAQQKTDRVLSLKSNIAAQTNTIKEEKSYVVTLLEAEKENYNQLEKDLKKKDEILEGLKMQEATLTSDLNNKKRQREKLNKEIEKIILAELAKSNDTEEVVSANISEKRLAWPTKGYISGKFGNQPHPTIKNVRINNNGIDITAKSAAPISAVADGKVISVTTIPGYGDMVIIKHGAAYYSVYSKLSHIIVKKDEIIQVGQTIGRLDNSEAPELHFEFWKDKEKLDPAKWLKK